MLVDLEVHWPLVCHRKTRMCIAPWSSLHCQHFKILIIHSMYLPILFSCHIICAVLDAFLFIFSFARYLAICPSNSECVSLHYHPPTVMVNSIIARVSRHIVNDIGSSIGSCLDWQLEVAIGYVAEVLTLLRTTRRVGKWPGGSDDYGCGWWKPLIIVGFMDEVPDTSATSF